MSTYVDISQLTPEQIANFVCTKELCDVKKYGWVRYYPSLAGNALFLAIFALLLPPQLYLGIKHKTLGVCIAFSMALIMEILGYAGRLLMNHNPFEKSWFLMYLIDLTIGPTFVAAGIYLCTSRLVRAFDGDDTKSPSEKAARWKPRTYTLLFLIWDILSLILQAIGGAIASLGTTKKDVDLGTNIMVAGLAVQVASLLFFIVVVAELAWRWRSMYRAGTLNTEYEALYKSRKFKWFLYALSLATLCIFTRSIFRVAELSEGFTGHLANNEVSFMILDGTMVIIACFVLTVMHPGRVFGKVWAEANWGFRSTKGKGNVEGEGKVEVGK